VAKQIHKREVRICAGCNQRKSIGLGRRYCSLKCWYKHGPVKSKYLPKKCKVCRVEFKSYPSQQRKFCSSRCYSISKRSVDPKICRLCSVKYRPWYRAQKYCSMSCNSKARTKPSCVKSCGWCKKSFLCYRKPKKTGKVFCSAWCYGQTLKAAADKKNVSKCANCSNDFIVPVNARKASNPRKFCGRRCMFIYSGKRSKHGCMSYEEKLAGIAIRRWIGAHRRQHNPLSSFTNVDFYIPSKKLCVYVDGVYWHRGSKVKDRRQVKILKAAGFKVLRISDLQIRKLGIEMFKKFLLRKYGA
jgi:very-short-patch-repair endonuclease